MIKILEMSSQNYRNGIQEWDEKLEQCPYYPSHQIRPTRFGHHLLQCRKALSKQPTSPYYHKIDDLAVSTNCKTDLSFIYFSIKLKYELRFSRIYLLKFYKSDTFWSSFATMSEGFELTSDFALLPQDWWFGGQY